MDLDKLVDAVTKVIMERLNGESDGCCVATFGSVPDGLLAEGCTRKAAAALDDAAGCDYVVMSAEAFRACHGLPEPACDSCAAPAPVAAPGAKVVDLMGKRLIHERDLRDHNTQGGDSVLVDKKAIITALAHDYAKGIGAKISKQ